MEKTYSAGANNSERRSQARKGKNQELELEYHLAPPVAAAAVLVIIASLTLVGVSTLNRAPAHIPIVSADINLEDQEFVPVHDLHDITGVIQFLSNQGIGDVMVIRLPESPRFSRSGEPVLINAADYSRRDAFR